MLIERRPITALSPCDLDVRLIHLDQKINVLYRVLANKRGTRSAVALLEGNARKTMLPQRVISRVIWARL